MVSYPNPCYSETYYNEVELYFYENLTIKHELNTILHMSVDLTKESFGHFSIFYAIKVSKNV